MKRLDRFFIVLFVCVFCMGIASIADETITLTTYYPAPYGAYDTVRFSPIARPGSGSEATGDVYYDIDDDTIYYWDGSAWQTFGGFWTASGDDIHNANSDNVGIGITNPEAQLHVEGDGFYFYGGSGDVTGDGLITVSDAGFASQWLSGARTLTKSQLARADINGDGQVTYLDASLIMNYCVGNITLDEARHSVGKRIAGAAVRIDYSGNVGIGGAPGTAPQGQLDVNGSIVQRGVTVLHADYVFEPEYELESIEEHAEYMWQYKHLKAVPKGKVDENGQEMLEIGSHRRGLLEELEKAHIYIQQLNEKVKALETQIKESEG
ncbi:dockerin type I domain-containing protein [Candidatus Omnitrophota bacterium]